MRDRAAQVFKIICFGLVALLLVQLVKVVLRANPLANTRIPDVPTLPADTNAPPAIANKPPTKPGTNGSIITANSNSSIAVSETNSGAHKKIRPTDSNAAPAVAIVETNATHPNESQTNKIVAASSETNVISAPKSKATESNAVPDVLAAGSSATNNLSTNSIELGGTNAALAKVATSSNSILPRSAKTNGTNAAMAKASNVKRPPGMPPDMMPGGPMMGGPGGAKPAKLPPEIQARVDRVVESEILSPIIRPMPMALLGIAGNVAFLRSPSGQTGLVKEGDSLGEMKLLRIGINRVLVEQDGQQKELMIFSGLGGESLVSKPTATSDETTKK